MADFPRQTDQAPRPAGPPQSAERGPDDAPFSVKSATTYVAPPRAPQGVPRSWLVVLALVLLAGVGLGWMAGRPSTAVKARTTPTLAPAAVEPAPEPAPVEDPTPPVADLQSPRSNWTTIENAEVASRRTGKPVMIEFRADWSPECREMKREVFDEASLGEVVRRAVVPVSVVDRSRDENGNPPEIEAMLQNYSIETFPTLVVYLPGTGRVMQTRGYAGAARTARWIQKAAEAVR